MPFLVSEETFLRGVGKAFPDMDSTYGWLLVVDPDRLSSINATDALHSIVGIKRSLASVFTSFRQVTDLDDALRDYDERLLFTKLQMFVVLILIAVVVLYYVVTLSSLVAEQRRSEVHLLQGRGASERQVLTVFVLEGATIAVLAIVIAPFLAGLAISLLGYTPAFSDLSGGERLSVNLTRGAFIMSAIGGILSFGALMIPAFAASRSSISRDRQEAARPSPLSFFQRYYLDVALLILGIVSVQTAYRAGIAGGAESAGRGGCEPDAARGAGHNADSGGDGLAEAVPGGDEPGEPHTRAASAAGRGAGTVADGAQSDPLFAAGAAPDTDGGAGHIRRQLRGNSQAEFQRTGSLLGRRGYSSYERFPEYQRLLQALRRAIRKYETGGGRGSGAAGAGVGSRGGLWRLVLPNAGG